jgi:tetratricopeptide (TPR) repeat protein
MKAAKRKPAGRKAKAAPKYPKKALDAHKQGLAALERGKTEQALALFEKALADAPKLAEACMGAGTALRNLGRYAESRAMLERGLEVAPGDPTIKALLGSVLLTLGEYEKAWPLYESRRDPGFRNPARVEVPFADRREWQGEPLEGKTLALAAEQGIGDSILSARFAPMLAAKGAKVLLLAQPPLKTLLQSMPGVERVLTTGDKLPAKAHDWWTFPLSVPRHLGIRRPADVPARVPYLAPRADAVKAWRERLGDKGETLRVGLAWAGSAKYPGDALRSIAFEKLGPLATEGVRLVSLQWGERAADARGIEAFDQGDLADSAALYANLDLVVSVDSAPAHLAGALGLPAWTLLPYVPHWCWGLGRDDTPWYPQMRLFRQDARRAWEPVIERAARELKALVAALRAHKVRGRAGAMALVRAGQRALGAQRLPEAERAFRAALALLPDQADALHGLAVIALKVKKPKEAQAFLARALASARRTGAPPAGVAALLAHAGQALRQLGQPAKAIAAYRQSLRIAPNDQVARWLKDVEASLQAPGAA